MHPFFSIIIPSLNEEKFIGGLLEDLASQSFSSFEIIHVDGHSQDQTCAVVTSFTNRLKIRSILSDRRNLSYQRNLGAKQAKGVYLVIVDADTRIEDTQFLQIIHDHCQISKRDIYLPKAKYKSSSIVSRLIERVNNYMVRSMHSTFHPLPTSGIAIFKRAFFARIGGYLVTQKQEHNMLFVEDQEIMLRAHTQGAKNAFVEQAEYIFSLRRVEQEGWARVLWKILISTLELFFGNTLGTQQYTMGGQQYKSSHHQT